MTNQSASDLAKLRWSRIPPAQRKKLMAALAAKRDPEKLREHGKRLAAAAAKARKKKKK